MRGVAKNFAHLPSSEVVSKQCKMAFINYTKCNKKEQKQVYTQLEWRCKNLQDSCTKCKILQVPCTIKVCKAHLTYSLQFSCKNFTFIA